MAFMKLSPLSSDLCNWLSVVTAIDMGRHLSTGKLQCTFKNSGLQVYRVAYRPNVRYREGLSACIC